MIHYNGSVRSIGKVRTLCAMCFAVCWSAVIGVNLRLNTLNARALLPSTTIFAFLLFPFNLRSALRHALCALRYKPDPVRVCFRWK